MVSIDIYGVRVGIRSNEPALLERARPFLPIGWKPIESAGVDRQYFLQVAPQPETQAPVYSLEQGLETLAHSPQLGYVLAMLEYDLELHVAEHTPNFVFVHAGVVGWQGRAIVIPGRSYSGKSSLVAGLCHAGASYYSDEYALFDADGRVHAYRRPLRLRQQVPNVPVRRPEDVQQAGTPDPLPVGLVVLTHFAPGARWQPRPLSAGQAILEILTGAFAARSYPEKVLPVLFRAVQNARLVQSARGEAADIAEQLLSLAHAEKWSCGCDGDACNCSRAGKGGTDDR